MEAREDERHSNFLLYHVSESRQGYHGVWVGSEHNPLPRPLLLTVLPHMPILKRCRVPSCGKIGQLLDALLIGLRCWSAISRINAWFLLAFYSNIRLWP